MKSLVLKVLFFLLIVVALGELAYLFLRPRSPKSPASPTQVTTEKSPTPSSIPLPTVNMDICRECININKQTRDMLQYSDDYLNRKIANNAYITLESQGQIISFNKNESIALLPKDLQLEFYIKLQREINGKKELFDFFILDKTTLENTKIADSTEKTLSYKDLKIGQNVKIVETYNLKEKFYHYEITVLE